MTQKKLSQIMEAYMASSRVPSEPPVEAQERQRMPVVPTERWVVEGKKRLCKTFSFESLDERNGFVIAMLAYEAECGHQAQLTVDETTVRICVWTRSVDGLSDLDKEYAKVADVVFKDVTCPLPAVYPHNTVG